MKSLTLSEDLLDSETSSYDQRTFGFAQQLICQDFSLEPPKELMILSRLPISFTKVASAISTLATHSRKA